MPQAKQPWYVLVSFNLSPPLAICVCSSILLFPFLLWNIETGRYIMVCGRDGIPAGRRGQKCPCHLQPHMPHPHEGTPYVLGSLRERPDFAGGFSTAETSEGGVA